MSLPAKKRVRVRGLKGLIAWEVQCRHLAKYLRQMDAQQEMLKDMGICCAKTGIILKGQAHRVWSVDEKGFDPTKHNKQKGVCAGISPGMAARVWAPVALSHATMQNWGCLNGAFAWSQLVVSRKRVHKDFGILCPNIKVFGQGNDSMTSELFVRRIEDWHAQHKGLHCSLMKDDEEMLSGG